MFKFWTWLCCPKCGGGVGVKGVERFAKHTRDVPKVMSNFSFACELGTAEEGECGGRWNQLLCYP